MADEHTDPYWRLRPASPTPDDEICRCPRGAEVMLRDGLTDNPLFCVVCNREVPPERLGFDERFAEEIANWLSVYDSLYRLWLASGEYETWAAARLSDPQGQVNRWGREIVARLNGITPAYYWWFVDTDADADRPSDCPSCSGPLGEVVGKDFRVCTECRIFV
jgi:Zn-ribbon-containing, possibly nucleic-acid-binding protein (DUF2310)